MTSRDDDLDLLGDALKGDGSESPMKARERKKEAEFTAKLLERNAKAKVPDDRYPDLDGDGITWVDDEYDEKLKRFYDEPSANADYEHWGKVASYSSAEAAALLLGKDPQVVTPGTIKPHIERSGFPKKYMQMYVLIDRAVLAGELRSDSKLIKPADFLAWAKQMQLDIPNGLINAIEGCSKNMETEEQNSDGVQNPDDVLSKSKYWLEFQSKTKTAINEFPGWVNQQTNKITVERVKDWLKTQPVDADYREADQIKKVLSDIFHNCP
ncbi:MAG: hypothetical protein KZQ94_09790 [Candidatus Thiodiazotropha sp. (ex Troendleina suluensis)]|nr:hypothetical protein [Candidatus Thiodiazotropha sp. (ex Troendleina suluensis)]